MVPRALPCALLTQHLCEPGALCGARDAEESSHGWGPRKGRLLRAQGQRCFGAFHGGRRLELLSCWLVEEEFIKLLPGGLSCSPVGLLRKNSSNSCHVQCWDITPKQSTAPKEPPVCWGRRLGRRVLTLPVTRANGCRWRGEGTTNCLGKAGKAPWRRCCCTDPKGWLLVMGQAGRS